MKKHILILTIIVLVISVGNVQAVPTLKLPYPGGETWWVSQSWGQGNHSSSVYYYSWDFNFGSGNDDLGKTVVAPASGTIAYVYAGGGSNGGWGNTVIINYNDGSYGKLTHLNTVSVQLNQQVSQGESVGTCGSTGNSTGAHIHYQTQNSSGLNDQSIASSFSDVSSNNGVPLGCSCSYDDGNHRYTSGNYPQDTNTSNTSWDFVNSQLGWNIRADATHQDFFSGFWRLTPTGKQPQINSEYLTAVTSEYTKVLIRYSVTKANNIPDSAITRAYFDTGGGWASCTPSWSSITRDGSPKSVMFDIPSCAIGNTQRILFDLFDDNDYQGTIAINKIEFLKCTSETCDGEDNDCDGRVDNDLNQQCGTTNVGECEYGTQTCSNGTWGSCVGEVVPSSEFCDNKDNNCNGLTDENLAQGCGSDVGECQSGTQTCLSGTWGSCVGEVVPSSEFCDNKDNNCNGLTDENLVQGCGSDVGECQSGTQTCSSGTWGSCVGGIGPSTEVCDGVDNDCNGSADNNLTAPYNTLQAGVCAGSTQTCSGAGGWVDDYSAVAGYEASETSCGDSLDNDCDGTTDGNDTDCGECISGETQSCYNGAPATRNIGECSDGFQTCDAQGDWGSCVGEVVPSAEVCDGVDNDCDGLTDNNLTAPYNTLQAGVCAGSTQTCSGFGGWVDDYSAITGYQASEASCGDSLDNDCDGTTDGNDTDCGVCISGETQSCYTGASATRNIGECSDGFQTCDTQGDWGSCVGEVVPSAEVCDDGMDNDCDGLIDFDDSDCCCPDGDVNGDGQVSAFDAQWILEYLVQLRALDGCQLAHADVNQDGTVSALDALCILQKIVQLPSCLDNSTCPFWFE